MDKKFIDLAYDLAKVKFNKKEFSFEDLWDSLVKKAKLNKDEQKQVGIVYSAMLQDKRFIFIGKGKWKLAEFLSFDENQELTNALYDFQRDEADEKKRVRKLADEDETINPTNYDDDNDDNSKQANLDDDSAEDDENIEENDKEENVDDAEEDLEK